MSRLIFVFLITTLSITLPLLAQAQTATPTEDSDSVSIQKEKENIEMEKLQLEDAELKLKMKQVQDQLTPQTIPTPAVKPDSDEAKMALEQFKVAESKKTEELAKANKADAHLFVLDLVNNEMWYKGVRYTIYELPNIAADQGWKISKKVYERNPSGYARYLYRYQNAYLLKYENRDRGIFYLKTPALPEDFHFLTPESITSDSSSADVRSNTENMYFTYDSQDERDGQKVLKYRHGEGLGFNDQIEFLFDPQDKMTTMRYGVLGER